LRRKRKKSEGGEKKSPLTLIPFGGEGREEGDLKGGRKEVLSLSYLLKKRKRRRGRKEGEKPLWVS